MVFSSLFFLFQFLPITLLVYYLAPARLKNWVLLASSLLFYAWGAPRFVILLAVSCFADYAVGARIHANPGRARGWLVAGLCVNLSVLLYFKYANFFVDQASGLLSAFGLDQPHWTQVLLPIGISFFTFQKISYLIDVYRGTARPAGSFHDYVLYVSLFPQLIAGPIVRYHDVATQIIQRHHTVERFASGVCRFGLGLGKKVLIANTLAEVADAAFGAAPSGTAQAWIGLLAYAFQIYFDFSGYSDMAIGLGRMFGIEFLENFNAPYIARGFADFWRRWHISLSNFMREYLYIPLGGNRKGECRTIFNLWIVFVLSGFWHGASWNFIVWGAYHGTFLSLDKLLQRTTRRRLPALVSVPATFFLVILGWVFFRAANLPEAMVYLKSLFGLVPSVEPAALSSFLDARSAAILAIATVAAFLPTVRFGRVRLDTLCFSEFGPMARLGAAAGAILLLVLSSMSLAGGGFNPFIYFRF